MNSLPGEISSPFTVLESHAVRKAARDAGFDIFIEIDGSVVGESSHAPLKFAIWKSSNNGFLIAFSMSNVVHAIESDIGNSTDLNNLPNCTFNIAGVFEVLDIHNLEGLLVRAWQLSRSLPNALIDRFEQEVTKISSTEREATVRQRVGQNLFREGLMALWGGRCAITGSDAPELLRASHAKPWSDSTDTERLDVFNGLLLAAHWDAAFDSGLITISPTGYILISSVLSDLTRKVLVVSDDLKIKIQSQHEYYLKWHRDNVFKN